MPDVFNSASTQGIYDALRARILNYVPVGPLAGKPTIGTTLRKLPTNPVTYAPVGQERLYTPSPPDNVVYPYAILLLLPRSGDGRHRGQREATGAEITIVGRPRSMFWLVQEIADICDAAMKEWTAIDPGEGFLGSKERIRQTIPTAPVGSPVDREVVQEMMRYPLISYPRFLNQFTAA